MSWELREVMFQKARLNFTDGPSNMNTEKDILISVKQNCSYTYILVYVNIQSLIFCLNIGVFVLFSLFGTDGKLPRTVMGLIKEICMVLILYIILR